MFFDGPISGDATVSLRMRRAGFPATMVLGGTSIITTAPVVTILSRPMVTPGIIIALRPIQTLSSMVMGLTSSSSGGLRLGAQLVRRDARENQRLIHPGRFSQLRPTVICFPTVKRQPCPIPVLSPRMRVGLAENREAKIKLQLPPILTLSPRISWPRPSTQGRETSV